MMRLAMIICAALVFFGSAWAEDPEETTGGGPFVQTISPSDPVVEARVVFIAFPDELSRQDLPSWAGDLTTQLNDFIQVMSHGAQRFNFSVITRPNAPGKAWVAQYTESHYGGNYGELNREVMEQVSQTYLPTNVWSGVEFVFTVQYHCVFDPSCGVLGWSCLCLSGSVTGFTGSGSTQRLYDDVGVPLNDPRQLSLVEWVSAQEYAHNLPWGHSPHSESWNPPVVNYGRYDGMSGNASGRYLQGNTPYHQVWLTKANWLSEVTITNDTRNLHVPEVRSSSGLTYRVNIPTSLTPNSYQYFVLANHQADGSSVYDAKYIGKGLLIWHVLMSAAGDPGGFLAKAWDLESGDGKFANGWPGGVHSGAADPISGKDQLEFDGGWKGSSGDFFNNSLGAAPGQPVHTDFSRTTNPNTNAYSAADYLLPQSVATSIAFENIHKDPSSLDMVVDVYVDPKQYVTYPNGGEYFPKGSLFPVLWSVRPNANILNSVDVYLSTDGGVSYPIAALSQPNLGYYSFPGSAVQVASDQYRARVVSRDPLTSAEDISDANFNVWEVSETSVYDIVSYSCNEPSIRFELHWNTSVATNGPDGGQDVAEIYAPGQTCGVSTPQTASAPSQGTTHTVVWYGQCQLGTWSYVVTSTRAGLTAKSTCKTRSLTQCASCPPPCHPPCEFE